MKDSALRYSLTIDEIEASESNNTNMSDYYYQKDGNRTAFVGGRYDNGIDAGL